MHHHRITWIYWEVSHPCIEEKSVCFSLPLRGAVVADQWTCRECIETNGVKCEPNNHEE